MKDFSSEAPAAAMDDFERRRELRRQKREEMRQEAERATYQRNDDDEEEAARERRRRARQERQRLNKDDGEGHDGTQNSITGEETKSYSITSTDISGDDEAALQERLARREERRQKRLKEALERQKELDPTISITLNETTSFMKSSRNGEDQVQENDTSPKENNTETYRGRHEAEETETIEKSFEKNDTKEEEEVEEEHVETEEVEVKQDVPDEAPEEPHIVENEIKDIKTKGGKEELKASWDRKSKAQNGESLHEVTPQKLKHMDKFGGAKGQPSSEETGPGTKVEAGKKLEELKRRRGESETGDFEKLKQKQQEATVELEELKKKREERRKIMEEEEQRRKQEEAERKAKEEEEKKKLKEEIERRRAEAAEKRQKLPAEDGLSEEKKPFKCFTPKALNLKIEERTEFLNRSAQKSVKASQPAVVSKIDSRLEQYTSAIGSNRPAKAAPADLPLVTEGVRNIKSKWEKGNVFSSPGSVVSPNKETAGLKVGVSSRINEWLTKTPETNKSPSSKPVDLRPGDVSGKRNIWEKQQTEKPGSPTKMTTGGKKSDTNGLRFEKEP
ncbi:caldesmon isoform X8 [Hyla sarda]|uniref:caldesmon isoform X8 n=1 Tax=Hyla sarda TaxID=327740 RepID=UPI0024C2BB66|nr:caldesmon isoform X8 [Hyla sarda]